VLHSRSGTSRIWSVSSGPEEPALARTLVLLTAIALGSTACAGAHAPASSAASTVADAAYTMVSADGVSALVPDGWIAHPTDAAEPYRGLTASPGPATFDEVLPRQGLIATRIDASDVGAPSDLYYLAAKGPVIAQVTAAHGCRVRQQQIWANHRPEWLNGGHRSPGDFVATASGSCTRRGAITRWSYFVAAPGFGPARERGIPGSGLYLIVAATPAAPGAARTLAHMIDGVRFGQDTAQDLVQAVRAS
jgi:hypothetical protein